MVRCPGRLFRCVFLRRALACAALRRCDNETRLYLLETVGNFARCSRRVVVPIVEHVAAFVLASYPLPVIVRAVETLRLMFKDNVAACEAFAAKEVQLSYLFNLASSKLEIGRCHAVLALAELALALPVVRKPILEFDELKLFVKMVQLGSDVQRHAACEVLACMLASNIADEHIPVQKRVVMILEDNEVPSQLVRIITLRTDVPITISASLRAMTGAAFHSASCRQLFTEEDCVSVLLVFIAEQQSLKLKTEAIALLSQVLRHEPARMVAVAEGGADMLCELLKPGTTDETERFTAEIALSLSFIADTDDEELKVDLGEALMYKLSKLISHKGECVDA